MGIIETLNRWDTELFLFLNSHHTSFWDYVMTLFTREEAWLLFYLVVLYTIIRKYGKRSLLIILGIVLLITLADQGAGFLKHGIQRLRPSQDPVVGELAHVPFKKGGLYGFVSAHASNAFAFATFSMLLFRNRLYTLFIFPWAFLIAYTRVYIGVHYPGDIICGGMLGVLIGWGVFKLLLWSEQFVRSGKSIVNTVVSNLEIRKIILAALFVMIMCMTVVALFLKYGFLK